MHFNREQQDVIEISESGCHLVLAPPGCGKTAVLAERIAWAHEHGVKFSHMACLTFTNRAARGMRERIEERLREYGGNTDDIGDLFIGNVHRFCSHFLFDRGIVPEHASIIDTDTSISILADFMGEDELNVLGDNRHRQRYSQMINLQHLMRQCRDHYPAPLMVHRDALSAQLLRELCVAFGLDYTQDSSTFLYNNADHLCEQPVFLSAPARQLLQALSAAHRYEDYKQRNDLLDFEDLLLTTYDVLSSNDRSDVTPLKWLQIDEVQDLNPLQLAIIDRFTATDATVVYLGDAQQAIFSFMGAKTDTLAMLHQRAGDARFHNFFHNYRSPEYLLNVFNTYAREQLHIDPALLPTTQDDSEQQPGDVRLMASETNIDEALMVATLVNDTLRQHPDETVAVVVAFNSDADDVSDALGRTAHFKISGTDLFATADVKTLLAHLSVVASEHNFIAWSHLLTGLHLYSSNSAARQFVSGMMQLAISPADMLQYDGTTTYAAEFVKAYEGGDIVVFDTETTGLNVLCDDVVQIAAVRVSRGSTVSTLNLFIETSRPLPQMLGDVPNPLIDEYARQPHLTADEAFRRFVHFARGCAIIGHNANFDYQIMEHNMRRRAPGLSMTAVWPTCFDTLKLARLLHPRQRSYKLRDLITSLRLEGQNSHLANDDIIATQSLMIHCYERARSIVGRQLEFMHRHKSSVSRFANLYANLYHHTHDELYVPATTADIAIHMDYAYHYLHDMGRMGDVPKLKYVKAYIATDMTDASDSSSEPTTLAEQLSRHMQDLSTMKEADLCGSASMTEQVFVSTVHKAKGLEFDTVIVFDVVDGKYPSTYANGDEGDREEARKLYVAMSRARRRLIIAYSNSNISRWGRSYPKNISPYVKCISHLFR